MITKQSNKIQIKNLELSNFRLFEKLNIDLDEKLTVLIGENGSGKTSILDAISLFLRYIESELRINDLKEKRSLDVKNGQTDATNKLDLILINEQKIDNEELYHHEYIPREISLTQTISKEDGQITLSKFGNKEEDFHFQEQEFQEWKEQIRTQFKEVTLKDLPVLIYYGCNSVSIMEDYSRTNTKYSYDPVNLFQIYDNALNGIKFSFTDFFQCFNKQQQLDYQKEKNYLLHVREAIESIHQ